MTGPEHYREAERLEQLAVHEYGGSRDDDTHPQWTLTIARAQVHATLALTAATAESGSYDLEAPLVVRGNPHSGRKGSAWGRAIYGERSSS
jgi:hypothetical protein